MKKNTIAFFAFLLSLTTMTAQEVGGKEENSMAKHNTFFGFKAGYNRTIITNSEDALGKSGMHIGVIGEYFLENKLALQGELFYTTMGAKLEGVFPYNNNKGEVRMNYIALPVMLKVYFGEGFNIKAGPQLAFAVKTEGKINGETGDIGSIVNKVDFGFTSGLGYDFPTGVFLDARVYFGGVNVLKDEVSNKNFAFNFGAGYKF